MVRLYLPAMFFINSIRLYISLARFGEAVFVLYKWVEVFFGRVGCSFASHKFDVLVYVNVLGWNFCCMYGLGIREERE